MPFGSGQTPVQNNFYPSQQNLLSGTGGSGGSHDDHIQFSEQGARYVHAPMASPFASPYDPDGSRASLTPSMSASNLDSVDEHEPQGTKGLRNWNHFQQSEHKLNAPYSREKYELNPEVFGFMGPEQDDELHDPGRPSPRQGPNRLVFDSQKIASSKRFSAIGILNVLAVVLIIAALIMLFAGWPIIVHVRQATVGNAGGFGLSGTNSSGQVPRMSSNSELVDRDTPDDALKKQGAHGDSYELVFSDEFETDGRTFYEGDDPFWEAQEIYYSATNDMERYHPDQATTKDGDLVLTMQHYNPSENGDLAFRSGMLQGWNKFCFRGGRMEARMSLPGDDNVPGFWPAAWTLGNLGRAGHLASTDGVWPYASYSYCDIGTLQNQSYVGSDTQPPAILDGDQYNGDFLSFLPGQRLSACSCPDSDKTHPGPKNSSDSNRWIGRGAPEIDLIEAAVNAGDGGHASQSYQVAPFNAKYLFYNETDSAAVFHEDTIYETERNTYYGGVYQQACSGLSKIPSKGYNTRNGGYITWAIEYEPSTGDNTDGYITWIVDDTPVWTITEEALQPDDVAEIHQRFVSREPMYMILNFGMSTGFSQVDLDNLPFPAELLIDWVRIYQRPDRKDMGCDGKDGDWPTTDWINDHLDAYKNPNFTTWADAGYEWPTNIMEDPDCGPARDHL